MTKNKGVEDDIPCLPEDVIRDILVRLPVKSLIRFQCVCRHWRDLFKTPSFITDHLHHSNHRNPYLLFQSLDDHSDLFCFDSEMQVREFQNPPFLDHFKRRKIVGSSNGLLCVETNEPSESRHSLFVWNPAIKEVTLVPETNIYRHSGFYGSYSIGFGFCPSVNDYKIVITYCTENYVEMFKLYSLRSRSWKEVIYRFNTCYNCPGVTVNGVMFWKGLKIVGEDDGVYREEDYVNLCFSFDLAMELWTEIPIPDERPSTIWKWLSVYEEKLALLFGHKEFGHFVIHLWVMEEGVGASGKTWNWIKKYTSNPHPGLLYFATMWINEIFCGFWETEATEITAVLFNPTIKKIQELNIRECDNEHLISNYVESLVSIGGTRSFTKFPKRQG